MKKIEFCLKACPLSLLFIGCGYKNKPDLIIVNNSGSDFILAYTTTTYGVDSLYLKPLKNGRKSEMSLLISDSIKADGCYLFHAEGSDGRVIDKCFGYYTNGASLNRGFKLMIEEDTVLISSW